MVRKECAFPRCRCKVDLVEIGEAQEEFCSALMKAQFDWEGFARRPDSGVFKAKTWLCAEHQPVPDGLENGALLGARLARVIGHPYP